MWIFPLTWIIVPGSVMVRSAGVLVTHSLQPSLWESVLPDEVRRLSPLLEQVDRWLDDDAFFAPFRPHFSALFGRPSIPMEVYLRMMFLKIQYRLGYESLCREVADSISWRIFCRLNLDDAVPAPSTLSKITTRCGEEAVLEHTYQGTVDVASIRIWLRDPVE